MTQVNTNMRNEEDFFLLEGAIKICPIRFLMIHTKSISIDQLGVHVPDLGVDLDKINNP